MIHPHHPFYGQRLPVIGYRTGLDPLIYVRLPDGNKATVMPEWVISGTDEGQQSQPPSHLLALEGLRTAARIIEKMRKEGRYPEHL